MPPALMVTSVAWMARMPPVAPFQGLTVRTPELPIVRVV